MSTLQWAMTIMCDLPECGEITTIPGPARPETSIYNFPEYPKTWMKAEFRVKGNFWTVDLCPFHANRPLGEILDALERRNANENH